LGKTCKQNQCNIFNCFWKKLIKRMEDGSCTKREKEKKKGGLATASFWITCSCGMHHIFLQCLLYLFQVSHNNIIHNIWYKTEPWFANHITATTQTYNVFLKCILVFAHLNNKSIVDWKCMLLEMVESLSSTMYLINLLILVTNVGTRHKPSIIFSIFEITCKHK
jgi:hypothetical protein